MAKKAVIVGTSGLIGRKLLTMLLQRPGYDEVVSLGRKKLQLTHNLLTQIIVDFDKPEGYQQHVTGHALFCCLGTTRRQTPDKAQYRRIDHDYPVSLAQIAKENGVAHYHLVSALGADPTSSVFYTKLKGETEADIEKVGLQTLHIYRPSLLTGHRHHRRPGEVVATFLMTMINPFLLGSLKKYRSIPAHTVALAMYNQSLTEEKGVFIHPSDEIKDLV
jgi:uncharacterized protein YbjT (DUF2867 family)